MMNLYLLIALLVNLFVLILNSKSYKDYFLISYVSIPSEYFITIKDRARSLYMSINIFIKQASLISFFEVFISLHYFYGLSYFDDYRFQRCKKTLDLRGFQYPS